MGSDKAERKHRMLIGVLEDKVRKQYTIMEREVQVKDLEEDRIVGEIDLLGIVDGNWDLYEVKVGDNPRKARSQLRNLRDYLQSNGKIRLYYYSGKHKTITEVE